MTKSKDITTVIGAEEGEGIAEKIAISGGKVVLIDEERENLAKAYIKIKNKLNKLLSLKKINEDKRVEILSSIHPTTKIEDAKYSGLVIDTSKYSKKKLESLNKLNSVCEKDTIIASFGKDVEFDKLENAIEDPSRFIGLQENLKDIIKTENTSKKTVEAAKKLLALLKI